MAGADTRSGAGTLVLPDLVDLAWRGGIRIPNFQRNFRWTIDNMMQLIDSIHRGYPIGSLLLWERAADAENVRIGGLRFAAPAFERALWVVDGQQRVTTLANVLHPDSVRTSEFALGYDPAADTIVPLRPGDDSTVIPLPVVFDLTRVLRWFAEHPEAAEHQEQAFRLTRDLREYAVSTYQVVEGDVHVLQDIFYRINRSGRSLSRAEVFSALNVDVGGRSAESRSLAAIAQRLDDELAFGRIDDDTVLQCILARRGPDIQREIRFEFDPVRRHGQMDFPEEDNSTAFVRGADALAGAVQFLRAAGMPHLTMVPYRHLLVVLTRFLGLHPELGPVHERLLGRWLWRAAVAGPMIANGSITGSARTLCGRIVAGDVEASLRGLLDAVGAEPAFMPSAQRFRANEAATKMLLCCWWADGPRRPDTGAEYTLTELTESLGGETTATGAVRAIFSRHRVPHELSVWSANRVLLVALDEIPTAAHDLFVRKPNGVSTSTWSAVLASHQISPDAEQALIAEDVTAFLNERQSTMDSSLRRFLRTRCEWGFETTPMLSTLEIEDLSGEGDDDTP